MKRVAVAVLFASLALASGGCAVLAPLRWWQVEVPDEPARPVIVTTTNLVVSEEVHERY